MPSPRLPIRLFVAAALAGVLLVPLGATRLAGTLAVVGLVPGWALALRARLSLLPTLGLAVATSPVFFGALALTAMLAGVTTATAAWWAACGCLVLYAAFGGGPDVETNAAERRIARGLFVILAVAAVLALSLPLLDPWWRMREDSWFHAAVLNRLVNHGLPLVDPYFSPLRLQYVYFYHVILAGVASLANLDAFHAMMLVNTVALAGCLFGFGYLASFFSRRVGPRVLGGAFVLFGMNGLFYLFYSIRIGRALWGETRGAGVLGHFFPWSPPGHDTAVRLLSVEGNQFLFLDKFMLGTALSLSFGLVCVALGLLVSARRGLWSAAHGVLYVTAVAGVLLLHTVVGVVGAVATFAMLTLLISIHSHPDDGGPSYRSLVGLTLLGLAIAAPYVYSVMPRGGGGGQVRLDVQFGHVVGLLSDVLPALILAVPFLRWVGRNDEWRTAANAPAAADDPDQAPAPPRGILMGRLFGELSLSGTGMIALWFVVVLVIAVVVDLPANNETKFSFLLFLSLAPLAVGGLNRMWGSRAGRYMAVAFVVVATLPANAIYFVHAFRDQSTFTIAEDETATYRWIERATPVDAVFIDADDIVRIPVLAARDLYWGTEGYARNWGYPPAEIDARRAVRDSVQSETGPSPEQVAALGELGRPVYVLCRGVLGENLRVFDALREDRRFRGRFVAGDFAVFELIGEETGVGTANPDDR